MISEADDTAVYLSFRTGLVLVRVEKVAVKVRP